MESEHDDKRVSLDPLDPETALRALLKVDPDAPPADEPEATDKRDASGKRGRGSDQSTSS